MLTWVWLFGDCSIENLCGSSFRGDLIRLFLAVLELSESHSSSILLTLSKLVIRKLSLVGYCTESISSAWPWMNSSFEGSLGWILQIRCIMSSEQVANFQLNLLHSTQVTSDSWPKKDKFQSYLLPSNELIWLNSFSGYFI